MLQIKCSGSPYQIGLQHGTAAAALVKGSLAFYRDFFQKTASKSWPEVEDVGRKFLPFLESSWPEYVEEMKGIAQGAGVEFQAILALNVRTEIAYGMSADGCTAFAWKTENSSFIGQNWDWSATQAQNIIALHIRQPGKPTIHMMAEAGIIGKIGLNSAGVGVTLNAIKAKGVDFNRLPTHLALRTVLNSQSRDAAQSTLLHSGVAAACHITICDFPSGAIGLECTAFDIVQMQMENGICVHSNHLVHPHAVPDLTLVEDSPFRLKRIRQLLLESGGDPHMDSLRNILKDEKNYPAAICRASSSKSIIETLFSIVMDVREKYAIVKMGRPTEDGEELELRP